MTAAPVEKEIFQITFDVDLQHIGQLELRTVDGKVADIALHID